MKLIIVLLSNAAAEVAQFQNQGYITGGIIALLILGYLIYTLIRPEKF
jgi:K+-transporting ATPase KdpF subunit